MHGIHLAETGQNTSIGLMIVNPDEEDITRHFHHDEYSIFSETPITPAIMTASIDVAKAHKLNSTIQRNLFRFMELMALRLKPNSLQGIKNQVSNLYQEDVEDKHSSDMSEALNSVKVENKIVHINPLSNIESILEPINDSTIAKPEVVKRKPTKKRASKLVETAKIRQKGLVSTDLLRFADNFETNQNSIHQFMSKKKKLSK